MRWFQLGLYDPLDSTGGVLLSGPIWPDFAVAHSRFRAIIETYHVQNDQRPNELFPAVSLFEVPQPNEQTQLRAFEQLELPLAGLLYLRKQNVSEPLT